MSGSVNKAIVLGNLGADPELRYTNEGTAVCNFRVATNERWNDKNGETQERTEWHRVIAWGKLGEICGQYLKKGRPVYVEGRLQTRSWEDQSGNKRYTTEIVAQSMQLLGNRADDAQVTDAPEEEAAAATPAEVPATTSAPDEDLPF